MNWPAEPNTAENRNLRGFRRTIGDACLAAVNLLEDWRRNMNRQKQILFVAALLLGVSNSASAAPPEANALASQIDRNIETRLNAEGLSPGTPSNDAEFVRRVYLDLHGVIPTAEQVVRFLDDTRSDKRARLIDSLLDDSRYGEYQADIWQRYLISPLLNPTREQMDGFHKWLAERFNTSTWDRITTDLLTATGTIDENPSVIYLIEGRHPRSITDLTDLSSRYLLGIRLNCAQCHDHPFVQLTRNDYWGMAAFFVQMQTPGRPKTIYRFGVQDNTANTLSSLQDAGMLDEIVSRPPTFLGGNELQNGNDRPLRRALAEWVTSPENPYFARAIVNRTWWQFFGRGIVNPVDDMHSANQPSHPELLELLSKQFIESGFDLKFLSRAILLSRAYQRSSRPGDASDKQAALFGRMSTRVLTGGQLYDSLVQVLGPPAREKGINIVLGARREFTDFFAEQGDPDPLAYHRGIPHLLRLMNSRQFAGQNIPPLVTRLMASGTSKEKTVEMLFLSTLSRRPNMDDIQIVRKHLQESSSEAIAYRELAWALLMSSEFSLNH